MEYLTKLIWKWFTLAIRMNRKESTMILVADEKTVAEVMSHVTPAADYEFKGLILINREGQIGEEVNGLKVVASVGLDIRILLRTIKVVLSSDGAL